MKWFKHFTDAKTSESLAYLRQKEGFAGIGRWWTLLEIIGEKMDKTDRCYVEFPIQEWCKLLGLKQNKLNSFLKLTENKLKTKVTRFDIIIRIEVPKLLELRDNYTKDLVVTTKRLPSKEVEVEVEVKGSEKFHLSAGSKDNPPIPPLETPAEAAALAPLIEAFRKKCPVLSSGTGAIIKNRNSLRISLAQGFPESQILEIISKATPETWWWQMVKDKKPRRGQPDTFHGMKIT